MQAGLCAFWAGFIKRSSLQTLLNRRYSTSYGFDTKLFSEKTSELRFKSHLYVHKYMYSTYVFAILHRKDTIDS